MSVSWDEILKQLHAITSVKGGFSQAHRGIITLPDGTQAFVKIGTDDATKKWAAKEVATYQFLHQHNYPYIPAVLSTHPENTGFALEALTLDKGWDWGDIWTLERLDKTIEAMDVLAGIPLDDTEREYFSKDPLNEAYGGWHKLATDIEKQTIARQKLEAANQPELAMHLYFEREAKREAGFSFVMDTLVHFDIRADNCPWNASQQTVRVVDWNWTQIGDRRIDHAAMLTHVQKAGLDVIASHGNRLDADALHWMAGFWLHAATTPIWPGGPIHLRHFQLQSAITALQLIGRLGQQPTV
jgi:thiamine kinase-like enzyme